MKQKTAEILFSIILVLVWSAQLALSIVGIVYIPPLVDHQFWYVVVTGALWIYTIGTGLCWIANLLLLIYCIILGKDVYITNGN